MSVEASSHVWTHSSHKGSQLLVMLAIANHAHADGTNAFPSIATLAKKCRMSERQIKRIVLELETSGELLVEHGGGRYANYYTVVMTAPKQGGDKMSLPPKGGDKMSPLGCQDVTPAVTSCHPSSDIAMSPESSYNLSSNLTSKKSDLLPSKAAKEAVEEKIQDVFSFWKQVFSLDGRTLLTPLRRSKITARLKQGYTPEEIKEAIVACSESEFHVENGHTDIELICRNEIKLDGFLHRKKPQPKQQELIDGFIDPAPPPDFADAMQVQKYFFDTGGEGAELYQDRPTYEEFKAGWLPVFEKRSAEYFELAKQQIREYEEDEDFKRRFNGEL